jgi:hypothetical protein
VDENESKFKPIRRIIGDREVFIEIKVRVFRVGSRNFVFTAIEI